MPHYTVYDPETGEILRSGRCRPSDLCGAVQGGAVLVGVAADPTTQRVEGGAIVSRAPPGPLSRRRAAYAAIMPPAQQLEAILEHLAGDGAKLEELLAQYQAIKAAHPLTAPDDPE